MKVSIVSVKFCVVTFQLIPRLDCAEARAPFSDRIARWWCSLQADLNRSCAVSRSL